MSQAPALDRSLVRQMFWFNCSLGAYRCLKGIDYVRTVEFPVIAEQLLTRRLEPLSYLDIGCGESILPTFIATRSKYRVTVIDKFDWVQVQRRYLARLARSSWLREGRFAIYQHEFVRAPMLEDNSFDLISAVSVIEHMAEHEDSAAVARAFKLLRPDGLFVMSSPYNHERPAEFFVAGPVYGERPGTHGTFYQRHYSAETLRSRILDAAPFQVERLFYAGHYDKFNLLKSVYQLPWQLKPFKVLYNWAAPYYAPRFLTLSSEPPSDARPRMLTGDTVFLALRKPGAEGGSR